MPVEYTSSNMVQPAPMAAVEWSTPGPTDDFWYQEISPANSSGVAVTPESAMRVATVMACVRVLSETIASLPLQVMRDRGDRKERLPGHRLAKLLHTTKGRPNNWQTAVEFREMMQAQVCLRGNAFAEVISGRDGAVRYLEPLHPDIVTVEMQDTMDGPECVYVVRPKDGPERTIPQGQMLHLRGLSSDGCSGLSVISLARETIGLAIATERHGASLFRNGARPGGVLEHPGKLKETAAIRLREDWERLHRGAGNAHRTAVLEDGMKYHGIGMTSEDAQFLETRGFQVVEICRMFRVPPHLVYDLSRATFSNIEHQSIEFVKLGLVPWLTRWEAAIHFTLVNDDNSDDDDVYAKHIVEGLLRGDSKARAEFYASGIQNGWLSPNDARAKEDMDPVEGGDIYLQPMNMVELGTNTEIPESQTTSTIDAEPVDVRAIMVADVANRIATKEVRDVSEKVEKWSSEPEKLADWMTEYYASHETFAEKAVYPLTVAFGGSAAAIARHVASIPDVSDSAVFSQSRFGDVAEIITKGLSCE